jgi:hypothetical protein
VLEFDEFMLIAGCTTAEEHTNVEQAKQTFEKQAAGEASVPVQPSIQAVPSAASITPMSSARVAAIQKQNEQRSHKGDRSILLGESSVHVEERDPEEEDGKIATGAGCKRVGCKATFSGPRRDRTSEHCIYHRGTAIFHEGSKGYTCCKRRVLEFDEFLTIEPCTKAESGHLFVGSLKPSNGTGDGVGRDEEEIVDCRIDHYETPADVRVTVYAKGVEQDRSSVTINDDQIEFSLRLPPLPTGSDRPRRFQKTMLPYAAIDAAASTFNITRFKIDLILVKQQRGESWPALERGDQALGYGLTFGRRLDA